MEKPLTLQHVTLHGVASMGWLRGWTPAVLVAMLLGMTPLAVPIRSGFLGAVRYVPAGFSTWRPSSRRQVGQTAVAEGEPSAPQRYAHVGIVAAGLLTALIGGRYRKHFLGVASLGAGTGALGVGLAFLTLDLIGYRPGGETL